MLTLLLISMLTLAFNIQAAKAEPKTITVPDDYPTIQGAINNANDGDTVFVRAGTYYEHIVVNKRVSLVGEDRSNTVIDGGKTGKVVTITVNNTEISGFTIRRAGFTPWGSDSGIYLKSSNNIITDNVIVNNDDWGIWIDSSSSNNTITYNNITDNWRGCMLKATLGNTLAGNDITNHGQDGIFLWDSSNNVISGNNLSGNAFGIEFQGSNSNNVTGNNLTNNYIYGISLSSSSGNRLRYNILNDNLYGIGVGGVQDIDTSNTVNGKPIYYWINHHNEQVPLDAGYVALINCTNITVKNLNLKNNVEGIALVYTNNSLIQNLKTTNNEYGVFLYRSYDNVIYGSNISNNHVGINLEYSFGNNVVYNNVTKAKEGILLLYSSNNNITNNNIANNKYRGVFVSLSSENNIAYNNIMDNKMAGIGISSDGTGTIENNLIRRNKIINNTCGVRLRDTSGNKIYQNNFVNNTKQAAVSVSVGSISHGNVWDNGYPSGGNYWSDYTGVDLYRGPNQSQPGSDGIGDIPYVIDENNQDNYPLMKPWSSPVERKVGVKVGDWTIYQANTTYSTNDPKPPLPRPPSEVFEIDQFKFFVQNVHNTNVTFQFTTYYKDLTEKTIEGLIDVNTGEGMPMFLIGANLSAGDSIYAKHWTEIKINETISRTHLDVIRETNHFSREYSIYREPYEENTSIHIYWEKATGLITEFMLETSLVDKIRNYTTYHLSSLEIIATNLWGSPIIPARVDIDLKP